MPNVKIPPVLRAQVGGESLVSVDGDDVGGVLRGLAEAHPGIKGQLFDDAGELNRYVNVYLNDEDVRLLDGLGTAVKESDTIVILPAMATIKIPPVLRPSVGGEKEVSATGDDVGSVLSALAEEHPATQTQLFSGEGELNRYVNVYLNDEDVRVLDGLSTSVGETDTLVILPAMAGGAA